MFKSQQPDADGKTAGLGAMSHHATNGQQHSSYSS